MKGVRNAANNFDLYDKLSRLGCTVFRPGASLPKLENLHHPLQNCRDCPNLEDSGPKMVRVTKLSIETTFISMNEYPIQSI